jgi:hypothetical protein
VKPASWETLFALGEHFAAQWYWYVLQFLLWATILGASARAVGLKLDEFLPSFAFVLCLLGDHLRHWRLEAGWHL